MKYSQVLIMYMYVYDCLVNVYGYCMYIVGLAWFWGIIVFIITTLLLIVTIIMAVMIIIVDIPILVLISIFICVSLHY